MSETYGQSLEVKRRLEVLHNNNSKIGYLVGPKDHFSLSISIRNFFTQ